MAGPTPAPIPIADPAWTPTTRGTHALRCVASAPLPSENARAETKRPLDPLLAMPPVLATGSAFRAPFRERWGIFRSSEREPAQPHCEADCGAHYATDSGPHVPDRSPPGGLTWCAAHPPAEQCATAQPGESLAPASPRWIDIRLRRLPPGQSRPCRLIGLRNRA
jgi:hypothetical protein